MPPATTDAMSAFNAHRQQTLKELDDMENQVKTRAAQVKTGAVAATGPYIRRGENTMSSRGFSLAKCLGAKAGIIPREHATIEMGLCEKVYSTYLGNNSGWKPYNARESLLVPIWPDGMGEGYVSEDLYREMKGLIDAGTEGYDPDEARWIQRKMWREGKANPGAIAPAMSATDSAVGGSFVGPPTFGPPIELLRNHEVMMKAGATVIPLGPTGSIILPRLTTATTANFQPENTAQAPTNPGTGSLTLKAKKVIGTVVFPGEWARFANSASEQILRDDLMKSTALVMDKDCLEGPGSDTRILGLATMGAKGDLNTVTPTAANQLAPQDAYEFLSAVEEQNAEATVFIMRPKMYYAFQKARWTPYSTGTSQGGFVYEFLRPFDGKPQKVLVGLPCVTSAQVSNQRGTNGPTPNQTYVLCGWGADYYIGMFGAIEFTSTGDGWMVTGTIGTNTSWTIGGASGINTGSM